MRMPYALNEPAVPAQPVAPIARPIADHCAAHHLRWIRLGCAPRHPESPAMPRLRTPRLPSIAGLRHYRRQWESLMSAAGQAQPAAATLHEIDSFGPNPGQLGMMVHLPQGLPSQAALVVALHGCTQTAAAYAHGTGWSDLADRGGFALLLPEQRRSNNANLCFNWFQPEDIARDGGELASIRAMIGHMIATHGIDPARVYVTGLSAGGAMAAAALAAFPEMFAAGAIIAGLPYGCATNVGEALDRMYNGHPAPAAALGDVARAASAHNGRWPAVQIWHGTADRTVNPVNAQELVKQWADLHGIAAIPTAQERIGAHEHLVWAGADGRPAIEYFAVAGMGHGVPLHTVNGGDSCGAPGPYMLEAGISSTRRIATFWGLAVGAAPRARARPAPAKPDLASVVTAALRKAGLLRGQ
jgi:poly(hydroxyalkanoate) depolymerase family esterase